MDQIKANQTVAFPDGLVKLTSQAVGEMTNLLREKMGLSLSSELVDSMPTLSRLLASFDPGPVVNVPYPTSASITNTVKSPIAVADTPTLASAAPTVAPIVPPTVTPIVAGGVAVIKTDVKSDGVKLECADTDKKLGSPKPVAAVFDHRSVLGVVLFAVVESKRNGLDVHAVGYAPSNIHAMLGSDTLVRAKRFALPRGYESTAYAPPAPFFHSFAFDVRLNITDEFPKPVYGFCYTVYEPVEFSHDICKAMNFRHKIQFAARTLCVLALHPCNNTFREYLTVIMNEATLDTSSAVPKALSPVSGGASPMSGSNPKPKPLKLIDKDSTTQDFVLHPRLGERFELADSAYQRLKAIDLPIYLSSAISPHGDFDYLLLLKLIRKEDLAYLVELVLAERSVLFVSQLLTNVTECVCAFVRLMYPFHLPHSFRPISPGDDPKPYRFKGSAPGRGETRPLQKLWEKLNEPFLSEQPMIWGVHSSQISDMERQKHAIMDLDTGSLSLPVDMRTDRGLSIRLPASLREDLILAVRRFQFVNRLDMELSPPAVPLEYCVHPQLRVSDRAVAASSVRPQVSSNLNRAIKQYNKGDIQSAHVSFTSILQLDPLCVDARLGRILAKVEPRGHSVIFDCLLVIKLLEMRKPDLTVPVTSAGAIHSTAVVASPNGSASAVRVDEKAVILYFESAEILPTNVMNADVSEQSGTITGITKQPEDRASTPVANHREHNAMCVAHLQLGDEFLNKHAYEAAFHCFFRGKTVTTHPVLVRMAVEKLAIAFSRWRDELYSRKGRYYYDRLLSSPERPAILKHISEFTSDLFLTSSERPKSNSVDMLMTSFASVFENLLRGFRGATAYVGVDYGENRDRTPDYLSVQKLESFRQRFNISNLQLDRLSEQYFGSDRARGFAHRRIFQLFVLHRIERWCSFDFYNLLSLKRIEFESKISARWDSVMKFVPETNSSGSTAKRTGSLILEVNKLTWTDAGFGTVELIQFTSEYPMQLSAVPLADAKDSEASRTVIVSSRNPERKWKLTFDSPTERDSFAEAVFVTANAQMMAIINMSDREPVAISGSEISAAAVPAAALPKLLPAVTLELKQKAE